VIIFIVTGLTLAFGEGLILKDGSFQRTARFRGRISTALCRPSSSSSRAASTTHFAVSAPDGLSPSTVLAAKFRKK